MSEGLRERKKAETRRALASAALQLAEDLGPDRVTIDAIAHAAGVSPRTVFNYFASKDDAIVGLTPVQSAGLLTDLVARPESETPFEALRAMTLRSAARLEVGAGEWRRRRRLFQRHPALAVRHAAGFAEVERGLVEEIARRTGLDPDRDVYPALVVATALGAIRVSIAVWQERGCRRLVELLDDTFDQLAQGLPVPDGPPAGR
jgi:AcrR family transcriptional regulator